MTDFTSLPVYRHKEDILKALEENQVIIVESPTGSGKTTQIPLILKEAGYDQRGIIGITQPRRIAAMSISEFIKKQLGIEDNYCGYTMRFADTTDESTRIKVMTDGILHQEQKGDPYLSRYSVIMVDDAHERSLNIDFILGLLKQIITKRNDIKVIVSSATINTSAFSTFFNGAKIISIDARIFPINIIYMPPKEKAKKNPYTYDKKRRYDIEEDTFLNQSIYKIVKKQAEEHLGDVLVFLSGEADIKAAEAMLKAKAGLARKLQVYPLYGRLSKEEQERVFIPTEEGKTKVVIATNIAETSITIDGITCVIDSGEAKVNFYNQKDFTSSLIPLPISKSSAHQRAGRAGRTQSGTCYRLYSEESLKLRPEFTQEEILRSDLAEVAIRMSDLGIFDYESFPFITEPKKSSLQSAEGTLKFINAIDEDRHLTPIGEKMVLFPLLPRHSRVIVEAIMRYPDVLGEVIQAVAFLSTKNPFLRPEGREDAARNRQSVFQDQIYGDFVGYLKLYSQYKEISEKGQKAEEKFCKNYFLDLQTMNEILHITEQLEEIVSRMGIPITKGGSTGDYLTCLAAGLLQYVCIRDDAFSYHSLTAQSIYIHPGSSWFRNLPRFILAGEIVQTSRMFARTVSPLKAEYLDAIDPDLRIRLMYGKSKKEIEKRKEEKAKKSDEKKNELELFGRSYPYTGAKKKDAILIPVEDIPYLIKKAFERGKVTRIKAELIQNGASTHRAMKLKDIIQEGNLLKIEKHPAQYSGEVYFQAEDKDELILDLLDKVFTLQLKGKTLYFMGFSGGGKRYAFRSFPSLTSVIDTTYFTLTELRNTTKSSAVRGKIDEIIRKVDETEDFRSEGV